MRIERIPITQIEESPVNPRVDLGRHDPEYQQIERSLERWNLVEPLVFNSRTNRLVSGHQRLKVLRDRGAADVDVSIVDLDEQEEQALGIALNKIGGRWDDRKLIETLSKLELSGLDVTLTGFASDDLAKMSQALLPNFTPNLTPAGPDEVMLTVPKVYEGDIERAQLEQETKFAGTVKGRKIRAVTCPSCGHEFGMNS